MAVLAFFLVFAAGVQAAPAGKATNIDGRVDITPPGQSAKALAIGDTVNVGDVVRTKSASKCEITWADGSIARLAENSRLKVTEFMLSKENRSVSFNLFRGKMHNIVSSITSLFGAKGSSKYEVHTPTSVCGVRGTKFFVYHHEGVSGALFTEGKGYGYSKGRPDAVKSITPGRMMIVSSINKPPRLRDASQGEVNKFLTDTTLSEKKKDSKKDGEDKGKNDGGSSGSGSGGGGSTSTSGSSSGSESGDSSSGGTSGSGSGDSSGGTTSGDTSGGTTPSGFTLVEGPTDNSAPPATPPSTITPVVVPVTQTEGGSTTTSTTFSQTVALDALSGTLDGSIDDTTNTGTLSLSGTGQASTSASSLTGTMSDGSTYDAYLTGNPGSWSGLFAGLTYKGGSSSFLEAGLSDSNYTDSGSASSLSASGSITRGTAYTVSGSLLDIYNGTLPIPAYFLAYNEDYGESTTFYGQGYNTAAGGLIAVWALTRTNGISQFLDTAETLPYHYYEYCSSTPFAYLYKDNLVRTDDANGHFEVSGDIEFMNDRYYGLFSMKTKATRTSEFVADGAYYFNEIGTGKYVLDPLAYHGYWGVSGPGSLYYNNSGILSLAGHEEAIFGGLAQAPWAGSTDFKAIGEYYYNSEELGDYTYYLWNTAIDGYDPSYTSPSTGGYFDGNTAGIWKSSKKGSIRAIYVTPVAGGSSTAGILTSDDISLAVYSDDDMWKATGTLGPVSGLTYTGDPTGWSIDSGTSKTMKLKGSFGGSIGSSITGTGFLYTQFLVDNSASPGWGIYNMGLSGASGANTFSGKPEFDAEWSAQLGGEGQFGYGGTAATGYWLATISDGLWTDDGQITANMSGTYLTRTYKGTIVPSPFYGVNMSSGSWIGESIGIYNGAPLKFVSDISPSIWYYNGTWHDETSYSPYYELSGFMGGTDSLWNSASVSTTLMGRAETSAALSSTRHIFNYETYSYNYKNSTYTTYDSSPGSFFALYGGIINNSEIEAIMTGLYIDPSGNAGFLKGNFGGTTYPDIAMWEASGSLYKTDQMQAAIGIAPGNLYSKLRWSNDFGGKVSIANNLQGWMGSYLDDDVSYYNKVYSIYNGTTSYPWGIWQATSAGDYETVSASWTAKAGGSGSFGAYNSGGSLLDDNGYWIADITGSQWSSNKLAASISGRFITRNKIGNSDFVSGTGMSGDMLGTYTSGTWQAVAMGTWSGADLSFSTATDWGSSGYFDTNSHTMVYDDPRATYQGYVQGIIGSTASFIGGSAPLYGIGTYAVNTNPMLAMDISKNLNVPSTADSLSLWFGGTKTSTSFKGKLMGLYANWNGTNYDVGYVTSGSVTDSAVTGNLYSGIGMWEITAGSLTSSSKGTLTTGENITPAITLETANPQIGSIAGTQGITGTSNSFDMYFSQTNSDWGVWRAENGGTYTETPVSGWYGATGEKDEENHSYSISHLTGTAWADGEISGTSSGRFLSMDGWGRSAGDVLGVYNSSAKTWQTLALGKREQSETLAFASVLTGNLYQVVAGTVYTKEYQRPFWDTSYSYNNFDPLRYETVYFKYGSPYQTYSPTTTIGFEWAERDDYSSIYKDEYHYYPNGKWVKIRKNLGVTHVAASGNTDSSLDLSDPSTSPHFYGTVVTDPSTSFESYNNYVAVYSTTWSTNALIQNGAFTGIMGGLNNVSLWSSSAESKTNLIMMGSHAEYNGSQLFETPLSYSSSTNGAFNGYLTGIIKDTNPGEVYSENPLSGLIIALYIDPSGYAGVLKGNFTGTSYTGINMWESTDEAGAATIYRYSTSMASGLDPLALTDNTFQGVIGPGINSAVYGTFGGAGSIQSPYGIMGKTLSIASQPDWGIFSMRIGLDNTYSNPNSANSWTSTLFGSAVFGRYDASSASGTYADLGYWYTDLTSGTWNDGKLTGTLAGEFITHKKIGTLEGSLLGTYDGTTSGTWQAASAGTYVKTQDVAFSGEIQGNSHNMIAGKSGSYSGMYTYSYWYNDQAGEGNYGNSTYYYWDGTSQTYKRVITRFDVSGPPAAKVYHKDVWEQDTNGTEDTSDDTYTFSTTVYDTVTDYNTAMANLANDPDPNAEAPITQFEQFQFHTSNFNGILAGVENLWTNIASASPTTIYMMGDVDIEDNTPKLFTATVVSFNPLVELNPYTNSAAPIGGAYFAYLGGAFGTNTVNYDTLDGLISGLYLAPDGSAGVLDGTVAGDNSTNLGFWSGSGEIKGYKLLASTKTYGNTTVAAANFASLLSQSSSQDNWTGPDYLAADTDLGDNSSNRLASINSRSASLDYSYYDKNYKDVTWSGGTFGVYSFTAGGTYDPSESFTYKHARTYYRNDIASYVSTDWDTAITNNIRSGSVLHSGVFDPATATGQIQVNVNSAAGNTIIMGADIKGLFDPVAATWQMVGSGKFMETAAFVNLINSFTTDAEKNAFMAAMKIPCINVGSVDLSGSRYTVTGNSLSVTMAGVNFYAYSTGQAPRLFATNNVSGNYDISALSPGAIPAAVNLTASNMTNFTTAAATFTPTAWNTSTAKWGAQVTGSGTMTSPSTNIVFKGGAAGNLVPSQAPTMGTFGGTAAGVVR